MQAGFSILANLGVVNGKCETLREGETSLFLCEPETFLTSSLARPRLQSVLNASLRHSDVIQVHI